MVEHFYSVVMYVWIYFPRHYYTRCDGFLSTLQMLILWEGATALFAVAPWLPHSGDGRTCQRRAKPVHLNRWHGRSALLFGAEKSSHYIRNFRSQISTVFGKIILPKLGRISKITFRQLGGYFKSPLLTNLDRSGDCIFPDQSVRQIGIGLLVLLIFVRVDILFQCLYDKSKKIYQATQ